MQIVIHGNGKMANTLQMKLEDSSHDIVAIIDPRQQRLSEVIADYDIVIDFSHSDAIDNLLEDIKICKKPVVIATTNLTDNHLTSLHKLSQFVPIFQDYNTSYGIATMCKLVKMADELLSSDYDRSLIDRHHNQKVDSPSGTSLKITNNIEGPVQISSIRSGGIFGEHHLSFTSNNEEVTITHTAFNRDVFAKGAIKVGERLITAKNGLYNIQTIFEGE